MRATRCSARGASTAAASAASVSTGNACVNGVLVGAWYTDGDDLQADRAVFDIRHLTTWVDDSGVKTTYPRMDGELNGPWPL